VISDIRPKMYGKYMKLGLNFQYHETLPTKYEYPKELIKENSS
jgi:hypothetical protein